MVANVRRRVPAVLLWLTTVVVFATSLAVTNAKPTYHVDQLTDAAIARFPGLRADDASIRAAQALLDEARLSPFFQFHTNLFFGVRPGASGTPIFSPDDQVPLRSGRWGPTGGVEVSGALPLYTWGKIRGTKRAARAGISAARAAREQTLAKLVFDVRRAYFGAQLSLDLQVMIDDGLDKLRKAITKLEELLEKDDPDVHEFDEWRLESALAQIDGRGSEAVRLGASAKAALRVLSGIREVEVPECPLAKVDSMLLRLDEHLDNAESNRPELERLASAQQARESIAKIQKSKHFPDILLAMSAAYHKTGVVTDINNPFVIDRGNFRSLAVGLLARWSLDFAGNTQRVKRARAEVDQLKAQAELAWDGIELEVTAAYEALQHAERREKAWGRGERETRSWYIAAGQGFQVGTTNAKDLVEAITQYFSARFQHLESIAAYNMALAELERVTGVRLVEPQNWRHGCQE